MNFLFSLLNTLLCLIILGAHLLHLISAWDNIPDSILLMYSGDSPSQSGPKELLFVTPLLAILLWLLIHFLRFIRKKFNYVKLTEENKDLQYNAMNTMLMSIQTLSCIGLISLNESFLRDTLNLSSNLYATAAIVFFVLCIVPPIALAIWPRTALSRK
ncbi:hypothetical protein [Jeotgalicoccus psychrophilus]|uniref:hypothetical protein n=1 Tax=Jeotgalicoccus psychrophilus TaxID=157228 RepID=UPI00047D2405|nr:hypothetical protein [Jeotgalicoccus psychrophilus]